MAKDNMPRLSPEKSAEHWQAQKVSNCQEHKTAPRSFQLLGCPSLINCVNLVLRGSLVLRKSRGGRAKRALSDLLIPSHRICRRKIRGQGSFRLCSWSRRGGAGKPKNGFQAAPADEPAAKKSRAVGSSSQETQAQPLSASSTHVRTRCDTVETAHAFKVGSAMEKLFRSFGYDHLLLSALAAREEQASASEQETLWPDGLLARYINDEALIAAVKAAKTTVSDVFEKLARLCILRKGAARVDKQTLRLEKHIGNAFMLRLGMPPALIPDVYKEHEMNKRSVLEIIYRCVRCLPDIMRIPFDSMACDAAEDSEAVQTILDLCALHPVLPPRPPTLLAGANTSLPMRAAPLVRRGKAAEGSKRVNARKHNKSDAKPIPAPECGSEDISFLDARLALMDTRDESSSAGPTGGIPPELQRVKGPPNSCKDFDELDLDDFFEHCASSPELNYDLLDHLGDARL